jgi:hypothetical protein
VKRKTGAIIQTGQQEYMGISFILDDREISEVQVYEKQSLGDLKQNFEDTPYGITLDNSSGYLFNLAFPFSGRRKIGMVIKTEMDELLPFPSEDMVIDFKETQRGAILAAAVHKTVAMEVNGDKKVRYIGLQSLSALYALKWAGRLPSNKDFIFIHFNGNAVVIQGIKDGKTAFLRQFIHAEEDGSFDQALSEILGEPEYHPEICVLISDNEDRVGWKDRIEKTHNIKVEVPSLDESVGSSALPKWLWSGFGAALIALSPKGEINLIAEKQIALPGIGRTTFYAAGCFAAFSILVWGLFYLDYRLKQSAYEYLDSQPAAIYKSVFPKSAQTKDVPRAFQEKIRSLERQSPGGANGISALELLNELSSKIDPQIDVKVNDFTLDDKEFTFSGTTISFAALEKIKGAVEKLKGIAGVDLQNVELAAGRQVKFKIRGKL